MAKRALKVEKPIEDMLKAELVDALKVERVKVEVLKDELGKVNLLIASSTLQSMPTKKRWAVYGRCST